jgi:hypothetical protein
MQLALEDRRVTQGVEKYTSALSKVVDGKTDTVGYVYAVNGKFSGADVYDSADLFRRIGGPKLLHSSAAEALAEAPTKTAAIAPPPISPRFSQSLARAIMDRAVAPKNNGSLAITRKESDKALLYETAERKAGGSLIPQELHQQS